MNSYHTTSVPSLSQVFLQFVSPENAPLLPCAKRGPPGIGCHAWEKKNLGFKRSLVAISPPSPDPGSCLAPGVVAAWLISRKRMEHSKLLQVPARMMATGFG